MGSGQKAPSPQGGGGRPKIWPGLASKSEVLDDSHWMLDAVGFLLLARRKRCPRILIRTCSKHVFPLLSCARCCMLCEAPLARCRRPSCQNIVDTHKVCHRDLPRASRALPWASKRITRHSKGRSRTFQDRPTASRGVPGPSNDLPGSSNDLPGASETWASKHLASGRPRPQAGFQRRSRTSQWRPRTPRRPEHFQLPNACRALFWDLHPKTFQRLPWAFQGLPTTFQGLPRLGRPMT